jgi:hypothetical protein
MSYVKPPGKLEPKLSRLTPRRSSYSSMDLIAGKRRVKPRLKGAFFMVGQTR